MTLLKRKKQIIDKTALETEVIAALQTVHDPEIPVNIYDLGLIYEVLVDDFASVHINMTLTTPGCPFAQVLPGQVETAVKQVEGINDCQVELVWDPPWDQSRMSEAAKLELDIL